MAGTAWVLWSLVEAWQLHEVEGSNSPGTTGNSQSEIHFTTAGADTLAPTSKSAQPEPFWWLLGELLHRKGVVRCFAEFCRTDLVKPRTQGVSFSRATPWQHHLFVTFTKPDVS